MAETLEAPPVQDAPADLSDPFSKFDAPAAAPPAPPAPPAAAPKVAPAKDPAQPMQRDTPGKPPEKPAEKPPEKPAVEKPPEKPAEETPEVPTEKMAPKALREAYDKLKRELKEREQRHTAELENVRKLGSPKDDPEKTALVQQFEELKKKHAALDEEMKFTDYEKSGEFKKEYYDPYVAVWQESVAALADYRALKEDGTEREATAQDLERVATAPSAPEARRIAKAIFGEEDAQDIVQMRAKIVEANRKMQHAKANIKTLATERASKLKEQFEKESAQVEAEWKTLNQTAIEKYPQWFKAEEGDVKGAEILADGFKLADMAFSANLPADKRLAVHSAVRNQAAAFRYMVHKFETMKAKAADLEKKIADYEKSAPGAGTVQDELKKADELGDPFAKFER